MPIYFPVDSAFDWELLLTIVQRHFACSDMIAYRTSAPAHGERESTQYSSCVPNLKSLAKHQTVDWNVSLRRIPIWAKYIPP